MKEPSTRTNGQGSDSKYLRYFMWICMIIVGVTLLYGFVVNYCLDGESKGVFGDSFGALTALFSGLAFAGVIISILLQREELKETRKELKDSKVALEGQLKEMKLSSHLSTIDAFIRVHEQRGNREEVEQGLYFLNSQAKVVFNDSDYETIFKPMLLINGHGKPRSIDTSPYYDGTPQHIRQQFKDYRFDLINMGAAIQIIPVITKKMLNDHANVELFCQKFVYNHRNERSLTDQSDIDDSGILNGECFNIQFRRLIGEGELSVDLYIQSKSNGSCWKQRIDIQIKEDVNSSSMILGEIEAYELKDYLSIKKRQSNI